MDDMKRHENKIRKGRRDERMRRFGLCLTAVLAVGMVAATSAMAHEVRWQTCERAPKFNGHDTGKYTESSCATKSETSEGAYELNPWSTGDAWTFKVKSADTVFYVYGLKEPTQLEEQRNSTGIAWRLRMRKRQGRRRNNWSKRSVASSDVQEVHGHTRTRWHARDVQR